jgi:MGT family glycosyltransferase
MAMYGHINPTLAVAQELAERGHRVVYYATEEFQDAVQSTGAVVRLYEAEAITSPDNMSSLIDQTQQVLPRVLDRIREDRPDVIVYDALCLWAPLAKRVIGAPAVALRPTYAFTQADLATMVARMPEDRRPQLMAMQGKISALLADIRAQYGLPPIDPRDLFLDTAPLTIIFLTREFQPGGDTYDDRFLFIGPSIRPRVDATDFPFQQLEPDRPLVYLSLGTIFNNKPDLIRTCFEALGDTDYQVVAALGRQLDRNQLGVVPPRFILAAHVPQLALLAHAQAFIMHAGMNSTMEAVYYGVPMVALPQMLEQAMTVRRIAELGVGVGLDPSTVTADQLRDAVSTVIEDPSIAKRVQELQQRTRAAGGYQRAADAIAEFAP